MKVIKVKTIEDEDTGEEKEQFTLTSDYHKDNIEFILHRKRQKKTFEYLMDCLKNNKLIDRLKLFEEIQGGK